MTKTQVEVITSVQRRRRWSRVEKERIVGAALEPGAVASEVAREAGIHTSQMAATALQADAGARRVQPGSSCAGAGGSSSTFASSIAGASRHGRYRVCDRRPDADYRVGRCLDGVGAAGVVGHRAHRHEEGLWLRPPVELKDIRGHVDRGGGTYSVCAEFGTTITPVPRQAAHSSPAAFGFEFFWRA
jgi:transposase-like protein